MSLAERKDRLPHVYRWLKEYNCVRPYKSHPFSHTAYDGGFVKFGPIMVGQELLTAFYNHYAKSHHLGESLYLSEFPVEDKPMRLLFDFDLYLPPRAPHYPINAFQPIFHTIQQALKQFVFTSAPQQDFTLVIGSGGYSQTTKRGDAGDRPVTKLGLHLIWPNIFVNKGNLVPIRSIVVRELAKAFPDRIIPLRIHPPTSTQIVNTWDSVVDEHIAKSPAARMLFSRKLTPCSCRKEKKECTHEKSGPNSKHGVIDVGRVYRLGDVVDFSGLTNHQMLNELEDDHVRLLMTMSLRVVGDETAIETTNFTGDEPLPVQRGKFESLPADNPKEQEIRNYLKMVCPDGTGDVTDVAYNAKMKAYSCRTNSRRCANNRNQDHGSATSYFTVSRV